MNKTSNENTDYMAVQNITEVATHSQEIKSLLEEISNQGGRLDDWLEDKISSVRDDIQEIYSYLKYGNQKTSGTLVSLVKIAQELDSLGLFFQADRIDDIVDQLVVRKI